MGRPKNPDLEETFHVGLRLNKKQLAKVAKISSKLVKAGKQGTTSAAIRHAIENVAA